MARESTEMKELSGRGLDGNDLVLRLAKKEVKKEKEEEELEEKSIGKGSESEGEKATGDSGQGCDINSMIAHPRQQTSVNDIIHPPIVQPLLSVKAEREDDSMMKELQQLREAAATNERTLKGKEMLLSMLTAKLEQVRKEKKAGEEQLMAEIGVREETSRKCAEFERQLSEEQQKNAQLIEELKLAKEKPSNMDKETVTDLTMVHSVDTSTTMQPSRAAIAAHLLGIDVQPRVELQSNEWKKKFEELNVKYLKVKKLYRSEQKDATKLRKKLQDKERDAATEELSFTQFGGGDQEEPIEPNEEASLFTSSPHSVSSPVQNQIQFRVRKSRRLLGQTMDFEQRPEEEEEDGEEGSVKEMKTVAIRRSANGTIIRGRHQLFGEGKVQKPVPPTKRMVKKKGAANVTEGVFKCAQCPSNKMAFSSADQLARHQRRFHGDRQQHYRHQCPDCGRRFKYNAHLECHMRTHTGEKPHKCRECGREFSQKSSLTAHERLHTGERPFVCAVCQKAFIDSSSLIRHERLHSGETPFSCPHCARQFSDVSHCRWHEKNCPSRAQPPASE